VEEVAPPALVSEKWWADETVIAAAAEPRPGHGPQVTPSAGSWLGRNAIVTGLSAGLLCALLIIAVYAVFGSTIPVVFQASLLVGLAGAVLTAGLAAIPRASMGATASAAGLGLGGALLGILMSLAALGGFSVMANGLIDPGRASALVVLAWTLCAVSIGIASGIMRSGRATVSGLIGGSIGGLVGGTIHWASGPTFVDLGSYSALAIDIANPSTLIALILACTAIGLSIGVVDRVRRQAWLTVIEGRLRGREIILDRRRVTIGSAAHAALRLADEPGVAPEHAVLLRGDQDGYALQCHGRVELNGRSCSTAQPVPLNSGDVLRVGGSFVRFQQREQA
ncbi:MAG: FHA domain-containing protein, partial [Pseudonocardia sp.]|nr:FHA domain-containing protein [Pseudonocardia sp.]